MPSPVFPFRPGFPAFSMFLFVSLACAKRCSELQSLRKTNREVAAGRDYTVSDFGHLHILGVTCGVAGCLVLTLYLNSDAVRLLYRAPDILWLAAPVMLYWIVRIWRITVRGLMNDDPVLFAAKDRVTQVLAAFTILLMWLASLPWHFPV